MNMGEKIFNLRKEKGISQEALAEFFWSYAGLSA